jgi:hypothetical protein
MIGEKHMFTSFEENDYSSDTIMFGDNSEEKVLGYGKSLLLSIILFQKFYSIPHLIIEMKIELLAHYS